ncbi:glycosyltransferase involved in cell wall biosynthesis [Rhizobium sp. PP-F2F-G48]|nr:glycosyltransferase involved in cell wall biosynthesis [Rhizobium sp. PP-F2F-G48]
MNEQTAHALDTSMPGHPEQVHSKMKSYVIALQGSVYRIDTDTWAVESAYSHHLIELISSIDKSFSEIVVICPAMSDEAYARNRLSLSEMKRTSGVSFITAYPENVSPRVFWTRHAARLLREIKSTLRHAGIVHSGMSSDIWRPFMAMVNVTAWSMGKPVLFIVDIDFRMNTWRLRRLGVWSRKNYLTNRLFHDPMRWTQLWLAPRLCDLVLLKSPELVRDFGKGRAHVKNFLDTVHASEHILSDTALQSRLKSLRQPGTPLKLAYFGRLVPYKGVDKAIEAVGILRARGLDIRLSIIGDGPCREALCRQIEDAGLQTVVTMLPSVAYGEPLFAALADCHASLATPLREDTPRSAFDSMARGLPIVAFDIAYFTGLAEQSGAVALATWPDAQSLAGEIAALAEDRERLAEMTSNAVAFARANTQPIWLARRQQWTREHVRGYTEQAV